jgi:hypothetical protein
MSQQATPATVPQFNYAPAEPQADRAKRLDLEEGKTALVSFLKNIPGMDAEPPFVFCKVHWNSEMGDNGKVYQCFGGSCCEQVTWQKGYPAGTPGKFAVNKAKKRYYIPVVHYEQGSDGISSVATIKYLDLNYYTYEDLCMAIQGTKEGLDFFERDIEITAKKENQTPKLYFNRKETKAIWQTNEVYKTMVDAQLKDFAQRLYNALPKWITEQEFQELKPSMDAKVEQAKAAQSVAQPMIQAGFQPNFTPQTQPGYPGVPPTQTPYMAPQPQYSQPSYPGAPVMPMTPPAAPMPTVEQPAAPMPTVAPPAAPMPTVEQPGFEVPQVSLNFDPQAILNSQVQ